MLWKPTSRSHKHLNRAHIRLVTSSEESSSTKRENDTQDQSLPMLPPLLSHAKKNSAASETTSATYVQSPVSWNLISKPSIRLETSLRSQKPDMTPSDITFDPGLEVVGSMSINELTNDAFDSPTRDIASIDRRIARLGGLTTSLESLPRNLEIFKLQHPLDHLRQIEDLTRQVGYLRGEVALLKAYKIAFTKLQLKTGDVHQFLHDTLSEVQESVAGSEQGLLDYHRSHQHEWEEVTRGF